MDKCKNKSVLRGRNMGKYEVPTCDCGEPLLHYEERSYVVTNNITKSGVPSKKLKKNIVLIALNHV